MSMPKYRAWDIQNRAMYPVNCISYEVDTGKLSGVVFGEYDGQIPHRMVKDTELMQWSGLRDCNGIDIFDSDIVIDNRINANSKWISVVRFDKNLLSWVLLSISATGKRYMRPYTRMTMKDYDGRLEVIGNIFEDTNLLVRGTTKEE